MSGGHAPETEVASDLVRRGVFLLPAFVLVGALVDGAAGAVSAALGVAIVLVNFTVAARSLAWAASRGQSAIAATVFVGYAVRLGLVVAMLLILRNQSWANLAVFGVTLIFTHVGLLFWETRYVSLTLGAPGLRPAALITQSSTQSTKGE